jgi:hypothetical protein
MYLYKFIWISKVILLFEFTWILLFKFMWICVNFDWFMWTNMNIHGCKNLFEFNLNLHESKQCYMNLYECVWMCVNFCEFLWIYLWLVRLSGSAAVCSRRAVVCGSAHGSVRAVRAVVCGSALGSSVWQWCVWWCAAVRQYGGVRLCATRTARLEAI